MLLKTLAEQKFAANLLEKHMGDQTLELEECRTIVVKEIGKYVCVNMVVLYSM